jgi:iron(III) transport system permease protein
MHFTGSQQAQITAQDFLNFSLLRNTLVIAGIAVLVALSLGLPSAYYFAYGTFKLQNALMLMLLLPLSIPPYVSAIGWLNLTNYAIQGETILSLFTAGLLFGLSYFPVIAFLSTMGFLQIEKGLEESARLAHSDRTVFLKVSIPLAKPFIFSGAILVFLFVVLDYGVPDFFMIQTYSIEIFTQFSLHNVRTAVSATYPLLFLTLLLAVSEVVLVRNSTYLPKAGERGMEYRKPSWFAPILIASFIIVSAGIPLASLVIRAGNLSNYLSAFRSSALAFGNTILFGMLAAAAIVIFGFVWAHAIDAVKRGKTALKCLSNVNLAIPGGLVAISLIMMWNRPMTSWIYQTIIIIILCNFARFSSIAFKVIAAPFATMSTQLKDLSRMTSGNYILKVLRIFVPVARNGLVFGFIIAFLFSIRELESALLILPPGKETVPIRIFSLIHYGAHEHVAVLALGLVMLGFAGSLFALSLARKQK